MALLPELKKRFMQPPAEFRSLPFWAWNDELKQEELNRQMKDMKQQGMGGFFMHSRDGLETEYMGPEWMTAIRESVAQAEQLGMKAWLYDEDRWPSGSAGGMVPAKGDEYRTKGLTLEVVRATPVESAVQAAIGSYEHDDRVIAIYKAVIQGMDLLRCEQLPLQGAKEISSEEVLLVFRVEVSAPSEWFNDQAPPDSMNADAVRAFIDSTYEVYKKELGDQFGKTVAGIFTDEPSVHDRHSKYTPGRGWIPWTYTLPAYFAEKRGYDILELLPYIYFNGKLSSQARHDYWRTVSDKFSEAFSKQLGDWCEVNGLAFTGHFLWEGALGVATRVSGAIMPHYRYQQVPGIDLLCEQTDEHLTVKQCTSVANQYGRKFVISETYGCTGWEFTFEGQKWVGDWQYVLGVNLRSQHLALYSLKGCRKRDYPPVFNYQNSWWKYNYMLEDYFARIGAVMSEGQPVRDILVLHPASTAWSMLGTDPYATNTKRGLDRDIPAIDIYGYEFNAFLRVLLGAHYDFDLGDETIMAEVGAIRERKLFVNLASYETVVIPPIRTMLRSTLDLLLQFLEGGGKVIAMAPLAAMIEGRSSDEFARLYTHAGMMVTEQPEGVIEALERIKPRAVRIRNQYAAEATQLMYLLKEIENGHTLFIINNDRDHSYEVAIDTAANGRIEEWDALTGRVTQVAAWTANGRLCFNASFGPTDSKLYVIHGSQLAATERPMQKAFLPLSHSDHQLIAAFGPELSFTRTMPNVLTLDTCVYRIREEAWSEPCEIWNAQRAIRDKLDMRQVYYNGITQRYKWIHDEHPHNGTPVGFKLNFHVVDLPLTEVQLVIEGAAQFQIKLNGVPIPHTSKGWFVDRSMDRVALPGIRQGDNELELYCAYNLAMEVEDCYLIGDFGVNLSRSLVSEPSTLHLGDWCMQGYYHYNGSMVYRLDYEHHSSNNEKAVLLLGGHSAVTVEIRVNGATAGHVPWKAADGVDLTPFLHTGMNALEIEVMGSPRNMFGPFHEARGHRQTTTGWDAFRREGKEFTPGYQVQPYGLYDQLRILRIQA
ncbi:glycosyl hydrolase [Paenibacillus agricola]|uniref:Alpha-L-rhamnosidase-like protein n=1 Tax=Paenibacillus agricola TaxID=2716264 RepID=A0ABX0J3N7_9BACL|nr:glycosyl hydrolase [Paenibacillus agricola]NHN29472.1 hypothetical protein [Paenibacillus agricola]